MNKIYVVLILAVMYGCKSADKKAGAVDSALEERLSTFMKVNDNMDFEKVLDYTYPKVFELAPRPELLKAMKDGFDNDQVKIQMDSVKVDSLYPVFQLGKGSYAKITYSMVMIMDFKNTSDTTSTESNSENDKKPGNQNEAMKQMLAQRYGEENVRIDEATGAIRIHNKSTMVAIKDEYSKDWTFVNLKEEEEMTAKLFSKEVLEKLATYK